MRAIFHFVTLTVLMINISNSTNVLERKTIPLGIKFKTKKNFAVNLPMDSDDNKKKEKAKAEKSEAPAKTPEKKV